jgi:replicative DNA helicase
VSQRAIELTQPLPHSLDAEKGVLSALLIRPDSYDDVAPIVRASDFFRVGHQYLFEGIAAIRGRGGVIDFVTILEQLRNDDTIDEVGGAGYLNQITNGVPISANAAAYAEIVREKAKARAAVQLCCETAGRLIEDSSLVSNGLPAQHERAWSEIVASDSHASTFGVCTVDDALEEMIASDRADDDSISRLRLGIPILDRATGGLEPGELWLDQGRTESLKTMAYLNRVHGLLKRYPDAVFVVANLEMPKRQTIRRVVRMDFGLTDDQLRDGVREGQLTSRIDDFANSLRGRLFFVDKGSTTLAEIEHAARSIAAQIAPRKIAALIVDHAGLVRSERSSGSAYEKASAVAIGLKQTARRLDTVVFAVVQSNRAGKTDAEPVALEAARDSGAFEENADFVLGYSGLQEPAGRLPYIKVKLQKNRRGPHPTVVINFDPKTLRMREEAPDGL